MLLFLIIMRMTGFVFLNPVLGRRNIPSMIKVGLSLTLALLTYGVEVSKGELAIAVDSPLFFGILLLKEFVIGYLLGFVMQLFDMIMLYAGAVIDFQLGISMAQVYDPQNGTQVALTGNILQIYYLLLFFATDGHLVLMKLLVKSGEIVPYSQVFISSRAAMMMTELFADCIVLAIKMAFPIIAFEFIVQISVGVMMKVSPQVNLFVLSIQLRIMVGFFMMMFLISPIGDYIGKLITQMLGTLEQALRLAG